MKAYVGDGPAHQRGILVQALGAHKPAVRADHVELDILHLLHPVGVLDQQGEVGGNDIQVHRVNPRQLRALAQHGVQGKSQVLGGADGVLSPHNGAAGP